MDTSNQSTLQVPHSFGFHYQATNNPCSPPTIMRLLALLLCLTCWALPATGRKLEARLSAPLPNGTRRLEVEALFQRQPKTAVETSVGTASIPAEIFNLIKLIVGAGALGLPAGVAAFGDHPTAILPAFVLVCLIGGLAGYGFSLIGMVCSATRARSYRQAWAATVGSTTSWLPAAACLLVTCCSVLTNSMIQADAIPDILQAYFGIKAARTTALLSVTILVLLPLCLMRSLAALAPFSLIGIFGMLYTCIAMAIRWLTGSYAEGSALAESLAPHWRPSFGTRGWKAIFSPNVAILVAMLSSSFMAHYNAPRMYWELRNNTLPRFNAVVAASYAGAVGLMAALALAGFGTFGSSSASMILNNYAVSDSIMSLSRVAVTISLLFTFPLAFLGVREGVMDLLNVPGERRQKISDPLTIVLLTIITCLAMTLKDIRYILSFGGATWGNCVIYIFPALMVVQGAKKYPQLQSLVPTATLNGILGVVLGVVGTTRAIQSM